MTRPVETDIAFPMRCLTLAFGSLFFLPQFAGAEPLKPIPLWPGVPPGDEEVKLEPEKTELKGDRQIEIMSNVSTPLLTIYPSGKDNSPAVLVCPGGGYNILAYSHEGTDVCNWLNSIGITAGLLKYRVPRREGREKHDAPLQDAQRAISMMRSRSDEWKINPDKIGILGFSAGGHLSTMTLTTRERTYADANASADSLDFLPNFAVLIYPAYLKSEEDPDILSPEIKIDDTTPPIFMAIAHGDQKFVEGNALLYLAMARAKRPAELHVFGTGGHGFGIGDTGIRANSWPDLAGGWMREMGLLGE